MPSQTDALRAQRDEYAGVLGLLNTKPEKIAPAGTAIIYLGDGYFADMPLEDAKEFVSVRVQSLSMNLEGLLYSEGITDDGLPIMDIYEELDEDGNVLKSSVERTGGSMDQIKQALNGIYKEHEAKVNSPIEPEEPSQGSFREIWSQQDPPAASGDIKLTPREPIEPTPAEPEQVKSEPVTTASDSESYHGISRDDMIELELLGDELGDIQVKMDEDEQMEEFDEEYEFEYDEDASEESDEDEFGRTKGSLFPTDPRTAKLLEQQLTRKPTGASKKSVSFSSSLEIKEFETTSAERKGQVVDPDIEQPQESMVIPLDKKASQESTSKVSLFKQRMGLGPSKPSTQVPIERPATSDIVEKPLPATPAPTKPAQPTSNTGFYSRKYAPVNKSAKFNRLNTPVVDDATIPAEFVQHTSDPNELDLQQIEPDALKYFEEATIPDDEFLALHDEDDIDEPRIKEVVEDTDSPVTSGIVERMPVHKEIDQDDDDMKEMRGQYHKLRQKLVYKAGGYKKTANDQAVDPVDEDGNPVKVSRFKGARMGLR